MGQLLGLPSIVRLWGTVGDIRPLLVGVGGRRGQMGGGGMLGHVLLVRHGRMCVAWGVAIVLMGVTGGVGGPG